jgi:hypothetical protein
VERGKERERWKSDHRDERMQDEVMTYLFPGIDPCGGEQQSVCFSPASRVVGHKSVTAFRERK